MCLECVGWFVNAETNRIERCDECKVFETDEDAAEHVETVYRDLMKKPLPRQGEENE